MENFINVRSENAVARKVFVECFLLALNNRPTTPTDTPTVISLYMC
jgi:hypothetical protein